MLQNGKGHIVELIYQFDSRIDVQQIVVRNLLSMNLIEHIVQITIEISSLMRILTISEHLRVVCGITESRAFAGIKIIKNSRIVMRRYRKCFLSHPTTFF